MWLCGRRHHSQHQYGARMTIRIKRCKNNYNGEQDVEWTVRWSDVPPGEWKLTGALPSAHAPKSPQIVQVENYNTAASPIYALPSAGIKLYGGDSVTFTCTYNTSQSNATVVGGYHYTHNEMCLARVSGTALNATGLQAPPTSAESPVKTPASCACHAAARVLAAGGALQRLCGHHNRRVALLPRDEGHRESERLLL